MQYNKNNFCERSEKMKYQKLFAIEYNNKQFMIFIDENDITTFLEINDQNEYEYPMLVDYLELYRIFNLQAPYVLYKVPQFSFKNCVKTTKNGIIGLLTVITLLNTIPHVHAADAKIDITNESVTITEIAQSSKQYISIDDTNDLDKYLGQVEVTKELILNAIDDNKSIPEDLKKIVIEQFETNYKKYPTASYRVFYENIKTWEPIILSEDEYYKNFPSGSVANYSALTNKTHFIENAPIEIVLHELSHMYHSFYRELDNYIIFKLDSKTFVALSEGAIDKMVANNTPPKGSRAYTMSNNTLEFLIYLTDYTYEEFSRFGLKPMLQKAVELYPSANFKYINNSLNTIIRASIYNISIKKDAFESLFDELFEACLQKATKEKNYEPFKMFLNIIASETSVDQVNEYFEKYQEHLKKLGCASLVTSTEKKLKTYEKASGIFYDPKDDSKIGFGYFDDDKLYIIKENGTHQIVDKEKNRYQELLFSKFDVIKLRTSINDGDMRTALFNCLDEATPIAPHVYRSVPINMNGQLLGTLNTNNLYVQVGFTEDEEMGYVVLDAEGKTIYKSNKKMTNLSNKISMNILLSYYEKHGKEVELSDILNEPFIKNLQSNNCYFCNFQVEEDKIVVEPVDIIAIPMLFSKYDSYDYYKISECKIYISDENVFLSDTFEYDSELVIDLKDVLDNAGILKDDQHFYTIQMDELLQLIENYIASQKISPNLHKKQ